MDTGLAERSSVYPFPLSILWNVHNSQKREGSMSLVNYIDYTSPHIAIDPFPRQREERHQTVPFQNSGMEEFFAFCLDFNSTLKAKGSIILCSDPHYPHSYHPNIYSAPDSPIPQFGVCRKCCPHVGPNPPGCTSEKGFVNCERPCK